MDKSDNIIEIPVKEKQAKAFILEGTLEAFSTEALHCHPSHQILRIKRGVTLLVEENRKQPLFSNMTAFIPGGLPHRSIVMGGEVEYKSIYLDESLHPGGHDIVVFDMSELGAALFNRIAPGTIREWHTHDLDGECLEFLLKLLDREINQKSDFMGIPVAHTPENKKITGYIETHFDEKIRLADFTTVLHYSERHITRLFKADLNVSVFEYLKLYRMFRAALMLCGNGGQPLKPVTDIAFSCGYESLSSFYKDFREIFSMTPKAFRQRQGGMKGRTLG